MHKSLWGILAAVLLSAATLRAQQPCPGLPVIINTPEDKLMPAVNGAETPQAAADALTKYVADYPNARFTPCAYEYLTMNYVKLQDFDKAIEDGEKDLAVNYLYVTLYATLLKAYIGAGKATDAAFDLINKSPKLIHDEMMRSMAENAEETAKDVRAYVEYAFFQLLPRVTDATKRIGYLDAFVKAGADSVSVHAEVCADLPAIAHQMHALGIRAAVAINPETDPARVLAAAAHFDMILVMSVHPGFGGQGFIAASIDKLRVIRRELDRLQLAVDLQVDGGIKVDNIAAVAQAGANVFVSGSGIFGQQDYAETIARMRCAAAG